MSAKIIKEYGALTIRPKSGGEVWVEDREDGTFDVAVEVQPLQFKYVVLTRKELKALRKAIKRALA